MKLILDTSSPEMQVILARSTKDFSCCSQTKEKHQKHLLPEIEKLLAKETLSLNDIDEFAVVVGPGSFTGIRLAVATVKACCFIDNTKKIQPINMLNLLAYKLSKSEKDFAVAIKCTSSKVYLGIKQGDKYRTETMLNADAINVSNGKKLFGFNMDSVGEHPVEQVVLTEQDYVDYVFRKDIKYTSVAELEPVYMALSQAEEELFKKEGKS